MSKVLDAVGTDHLHQPLGHAAEQGRGDQEGLQAQVPEPDDGRHRVVGVQGGKDQMAGHRRLDRMGGGFQVADLADHDDVRILAQDIAQDGGEGDVDQRLHRDLVKLLMHHLHRIFDGDDIFFRRGDFLQGGIEGGRFAAAGRAGDQDNAVGGGDEAVVDHQIPLGKPETVDLLEDHVRIENPHDRLFAEGHRHGRDPDLDILAALFANLDPAVLGPPSFRRYPDGARNLIREVMAE